MRHNQFYTVEKSAQEIKEMQDWALGQIAGKAGHENPYAYGVLTCFLYLTGQLGWRPQDYKGAFTIKNLNKGVREAEEQNKERDPWRVVQPKCAYYPENLLALNSDMPIGSGIDNVEFRLGDIINELTSGVKMPLDSKPEDLVFRFKDIVEKLKSSAEWLLDFRGTITIRGEEH